MAFQGTKNFPGKGIITTLEKHGVAFGRNINAYTAHNETVYNLSSVPTDNPALFGHLPPHSPRLVLLPHT